MQDLTFPDLTTFRRLGSKLELVAKVIIYCKGRSEFADVMTICAAIKVHADGNENGVKGTEPAFEFVYLMKSGRHHKIGRSNAVGRREYELGILLPDPSSTIHKIKTDDAPGIEAYWHGRFAAKRKNGEWFELDADVNTFKRRKFM